jgi:conjugative relaxase-like TrwC/TraI family protein
VRELGYEIETGKASLFEIKGVPAEVMTAFSTRSAAIDAALHERGTSRDTASAMEKQIAALDTRQAKVAIGQANLVYPLTPLVSPDLNSWDEKDLAREVAW